MLKIGLLKNVAVGKTVWGVDLETETDEGKVSFARFFVGNEEDIPYETKLSALRHGIEPLLFEFDPQDQFAYYVDLKNIKKVLKDLQKVFDSINLWREIKKEPKMELPLSQEEVNEVADKIDCDLSPENLTCDGELSQNEVRRKSNTLRNALAQLEQYASKNGLKVKLGFYGK